MSRWNGFVRFTCICKLNCAKAPSKNANHPALKKNLSRSLCEQHKNSLIWYLFIFEYFYKHLNSWLGFRLFIYTRVWQEVNTLLKINALPNRKWYFSTVLLVAMQCLSFTLWIQTGTFNIVFIKSEYYNFVCIIAAYVKYFFILHVHFYF